jgi:hypothetical protein
LVAGDIPQARDGLLHSLLAGVESRGVDAKGPGRRKQGRDEIQPEISDQFMLIIQRKTVRRSELAKEKFRLSAVLYGRHTASST